MREPQHKPTVEVGKAQEVAELGHCLRGRPIVDDLDLGWIHMYTLLIHDVSQILDSLHVQRNISPNWHITCVVTGCPIPIEYAPNVPPRFC
jgi:hypothetical protein